MIPVVLAKAGFERRKVEREDIGQSHEYTLKTMILIIYIDNEGYEGVLLPLLEAQSLIRESMPVARVPSLAH